jgi:error-prone DNA polymerase
MGFYAPAQIVRDAREHRVVVLPVDVNHSQWDCALEKAGPDDEAEPPALRLGMRLISGLRETEACHLAATVAARGPFSSVTTLWRASRVRAATLRTLAAADAFASMGLDRQAALWAVMRLKDEVLPMFDAHDTDDLPADLPAVAPATRVIHDYAATGFSLKAHPLAFARRQLARLGVTPTEHLADERRWLQDKRIAVAGLVLVRQRPATAHGILFMTIEDEGGIANLIIRPTIYERFRRAIRHSVAVVAWGKVERQGQVVHVLVDRAVDMAQWVGKDSAVKPAVREFR